MGGERDGRRATFFVELPVKQWVPEMIETLSEDSLNPHRHKRILVVDDEESVAEVIARGLEDQGHEVDAVLSAEAALEKLTSKDYDLIVSDIRMPGLSGEQLHERIAESDPGLAQRIIFITGDVISPSTQHFLQETKNTHIAKPFHLDELQKLVEKTFAATDKLEGNPAKPPMRDECEPA